jgi:hypothetical protein
MPLAAISEVLEHNATVTVGGNAPPGILVYHGHISMLAVSKQQFVIEVR